MENLHFAVDTERRVRESLFTHLVSVKRIEPTYPCDDAGGAGYLASTTFFQDKQIVIAACLLYSVIERTLGMMDQVLESRLLGWKRCHPISDGSRHAFQPRQILFFYWPQHKIRWHRWILALSLTARQKKACAGRDELLLIRGAQRSLTAYATGKRNRREKA